ncbi:MAG: xanthine dehydrogenase molybdopterin binding subunit [Burkholderiales bacterium]
MNAPDTLHPESLTGAIGRPIGHDSAARHVSGAAPYADDIVELRGTLHAAFGLSQRSHARIVSMDLSKVRAAPGVVAVIGAADIPGKNNFGAVMHDDPIFSDIEVQHFGQALFLVAASSHAAARRAARLADIVYEDLPAIIEIEDALAKQSYVLPSVTLERGDWRAALEAAPHRLKGALRSGAQEQFYLEGQIAYAIPGEDQEMLVHSSTQHPTEVQHMVAEALGVSLHRVTVSCRRMGGAFGGKESQPALFAAAAAVMARHTGRPVKLRADRDDDFLLTGKRHDFLMEYEVGFDAKGHILGLDVMLASRCGYSADLSGPVNDRSVMHIDNCYFLENVRVVSHRCRTHTQSATAFRGFGGPQGMMVAEQVIDEIARHLKIDPLEIRKRNFYDSQQTPGARSVTHYDMPVEDFIADGIVEKLAHDAAYTARREEITRWNSASPIVKRGLALTPVKFGISFTATHLNQAGALVHVYTDGSVLLNHGGTEMGQGLFVKVAQVVAQTLGIDIDHIKPNATDTSKVPNTSATAASSGSDINGKAAQAAALEIRARLAGIAARHFAVDATEIQFANNRVSAGAQSLPFDELVMKAYMAREQLWADGFYRTPKISYDPRTLKGRPFYYFSYGAALTEVAIDTLTGESKLLRVDILHDAGRSLNPAIDLGQIEGGFIQGAGWLTSEQLHWDKEGRLRTHSPSTYKIPTAYDIPKHFAVKFWKDDNREETIYRSKAVGEPPLMLALSVFHAIRDAIAAAGDYRHSPRLDAPATPEEILRSVDEIQARDHSRSRLPS